jgi:hypothetical protein
MPSSANPFGDFFDLPYKNAGSPYATFGLPAANPASYGSTGAPGDASSLPSGGGSGDGGPDWGGIAGAVAPFVASAFGNNPYKGQRDTNIDAVSTLAKTLAQQGGGLSAEGQQALSPVLQYLFAVTGNDPAALNTAIQPEKARVLDQYDTARKALQFTPRGGGQASATLQAGARAASDISTLTAEARRTGISNLATLGKGLLDTGVGETNAAARAYGDAAALYGRASDAQGSSLASFGAALGKALPAIIAAF